MLKQPLSLEHALLGFLKERPLHAYEIYQMLKQAQALGLVWRVKQSQLYALLARLEEAGYLSSTAELQENRPPRKVMRLTDEGEHAFAEWLMLPVTHGRDLRLEFLAKLFFAARAGPAAVTQLIQAQRRLFQAQLVSLHSQAAAIHNQRAYDWLVLQFRIGQMEAMLAWLETCKTTLVNTVEAAG